jgi:hypothetical protein
MRLVAELFIPLAAALFAVVATVELRRSWHVTRSARRP